MTLLELIRDVAADVKTPKGLWWEFASRAGTVELQVTNGFSTPVKLLSFTADKTLLIYWRWDQMAGWAAIGASRINLADPDALDRLRAVVIEIASEAYTISR